ncbi:MAG: TrkA family potassium uptake protein [Coriobacteriales bacterium]|nr:TrkA family potassium uptake protein [Coriobacteriales bacterium]
MDIIVVGCGRVGSKLANLFADNGFNVTVIDKDAKAFTALGSGFNGRFVEGIGYDEQVLAEAGVDHSDVVAAVTSSDNANLMVVEVARKLFEVRHVVARLFNPERESAYSQLGIDFACGTSLVADEIFAKVLSGHGSHIGTFGEFEVLRFSLNLTLDRKKTIKVSELERDHDIRIIAFERKDASASSIPTKDSILYNGDTVMACVRNDLIDSFKRYMR